MNLLQRFAAGVSAFANPDTTTSTLANPSSELREAFLAVPTVSGANVTTDTALGVSAFNACVKVISEDVPGLPWFVYQETDDIRQRAKNHPLYWLLHDNANDEMSSFTWRETTVVNMCTNGNGYTWIDFDNAGRPRALWPLAPSRMEIWRGPDKKLYYVYRFLDGTVTSFPASQILHTHLMSKDGIVGISPIDQMREDLGLSMTTREFGGRYFSNNLHAGGWFMVNGTLSDTAYTRLQKTINDKQGTRQAHKWRIAEEGAQVKESEISADKAQFLETRVHEMREVARYFRMKAHKIGDLERSTNNNIEHQGIEHVVDVIQPWAIRFETEINRKCLTPAERKAGFTNEMLLDGLLRGDALTRATVQTKRVGMALLKPNEARRQENLPPDPDGDVLFIQSGFVPLSKAVSPDYKTQAAPTVKVADLADVTALEAQLEGVTDADEVRAVVNRYCRRHPDAERAAKMRVALREAIDADDTLGALRDLLLDWKHS